MARVFRQKYFPNGCFLDSQLGRHPSYAWRSIWNAQKLLKVGLIWRVGDGKSIKIWGDRWIPSPSSFAIQTPLRFLDCEEKVCSLIDPETHWWNIPLLNEVFNAEEAIIVSSIPICSRR